MKMLEGRDLEVGYRGKLVLHGVTLSVRAGEVVGLIGHNGAGKSTLLKALFGLVPVAGGEVRFRGEPITNRDAALNVGSGLSFVPQARGLFTELKVEENLRLGGYAVRDPAAFGARLASVYSLFPVLRERSAQIAGSLSGGEQQMVALGIALMQGPAVLLLDEPSLGLSPLLIEQVLNCVRSIAERLGTSVLIAEQNVRQLLQIADRVYGLKVGRVVLEGSPAELDGARFKELF